MECEKKVIFNATLNLCIFSSQFVGFPFIGTLFTGFILTPSGPKVLEYNVRFGDPETEALMLLLGADVDLVAFLLASYLVFTAVRY
jgi:phosphoribosylamine--glycine ligase/phosphoribosylformylglycinamidine cyclo-ligase